MFELHKVYHRMLEYIKQHPNQTDNEIARGMKLSRSDARNRRSKLKKLGFVVKGGYKYSQKDRRWHTTWKAR